MDNRAKQMFENDLTELDRATPPTATWSFTV
jgi:hypothetical protein